MKQENSHHDTISRVRIEIYRTLDDIARQTDPFNRETLLLLRRYQKWALRRVTVADWLDYTASTDYYDDPFR